MLQMGYKHHIVGGKRHEQYRNLNTLNPSPLPHFIWSYFGWVTEWLRYSDIGVNDGGLMGWWTPSSLQRLDFQYLTLQWSDKWRDSRSTCPLCNWKTIHFCKRTACLCSCQHDLNLAAAKLLQEMISIISDSLAYCSSLEGCPYLLSPRPFAPSVQQWPGHLGQHGKKKHGHRLSSRLSFKIKNVCTASFSISWLSLHSLQRTFSQYDIVLRNWLQRGDVA